MTRIIAVALAAIGLLLIVPPWPAAAQTEEDLMHDAALFCRWMDADPTPRGVVTAIDDMVHAGVQKTTTNGIVNYALIFMCPEYQDEAVHARDIYVRTGGS